MRELKHKRLGSGFKDSFEEAKEQINQLTKKNKVLKEELRNTNLKYDSIEEELAIKNLQLKEVKQKN